MSQIADEHRWQSPKSVRCGVVTVSDSRTSESDRGGALIATLLSAAGHQVIGRQLVPDDPEKLSRAIKLAIEGDAQVVLVTGGTGISSRDRTYETVSGMLNKVLPGYGELLRMLSFAEIGSAAMLSRAVGGVLGSTVVLTMPGSPAGVKLAMEKLILPELGHLVREANR